MKHKKWILIPFIGIPILIVALRVFHPAPHKPPPKIREVTRGLIPPLELLFHYFDFNEKNALHEWGEKVFKGHVVYQLDFEEKNGFVHSKSSKSASAIFYRIKVDLSKYPYLYWKWRAGKFPDKRAAKTPQNRDDYAARVYVIFASRFFTNFKCVEYVWDETLREGTALESPYTNHIRQLVVQTGPSRANEWIPERQNVADDYQKLFGEKPRMKVAAIAIMTDSEGTETEAEGFFDDIQIGRNSVQHLA